MDGVAVTERSAAEAVLRILLRFSACVLLLAFAAALLPFEWMAAIHARLGLGELPRAPIVEYLARSLSLLYGVHGAIVLFVSRDPRRHASLVLFIGWISAGLGIALTLVDVAAGMPMWWTLGEGPPLLAFSAVVVVLARRL